MDGARTRGSLNILLRSEIEGNRVQESEMRRQQANSVCHLVDQDCGAAAGAAGFGAFRRGVIAFTTMVMFGRKSDSY